MLGLFASHVAMNLDQLLTAAISFFDDCEPVPEPI